MATDKKKTSNNVTTQAPKVFNYQQSDAVTQAQNLLQNQINSKPGAYQSQWKSEIDNLMGQIQNRGKFEYNVNSDALYNQYKDQYIRQGKQAMMDTMGQAAALTGGYGNSYAQTVGQQTYQGYLQQLNDRIPELYQLALDKYSREGQELYNQYGLLSDREEQDYGRYRDQLSDYYTETDRLTDDYRYAYDMDYSQYRDTVADQQWQAEFDESKRQFDLNYAKSSGSGSSAQTPVVSGTFQGSKGSLTKKALQTQPFSGTTYADAVAYLKRNGLSTSGLLSNSEWNNLYAQYQMTGRGSAEVTNYKSYKDYLQDYIEFQESENVVAKPDTSLGAFSQTAVNNVLARKKAGTSGNGGKGGKF